MKHFLALMILLAGCAPESKPERTLEQATADLNAAIAAHDRSMGIETDPDILAINKEVDAAMAATEAAPPAGQPTQLSEREKPVILCWQDYCPCSPPQGGPDAGLCRQLKAGMDVDPQMLAAGAMMRDARQQMDAFPEFQ